MVKKFLAADTVGACLTSGDAMPIMASDQSCAENLLTDLTSIP